MDSIFISAAFVCLSLLIVALGLRIYQLKDLVDEILPKPRVGDWVPEYSTSTLDGVPVVLGNPQSRLQVFYFFTPTCPICEEAEPQIAAIHRWITNTDDSVEMYGVSSASKEMLHSYAADGRGPYPVIPLESKKIMSLMQVSSVPTLVVVDRQGIVRWAHMGLVDSVAERELGNILFADELQYD